MGHFGASVHVGVRFKAQVHHRSDGPGLLGAAISKAVFLTRASCAVSRTRRWMSLPTNFLAIDGFSRLQLLALWTRLPLPQLSSSHSFHHARTVAARNVVSRCRVQTVPRYSAHSPPTACPPSCPRFC